MSTRPLRTTFLTGLALAALCAACDSTTSTPASALRLPIDFAWGCEGDGHTQLAQNDESAKATNDTRMCPDVGGSQGELYGLALDRQPAGVVVLQLNPAAGDRGFIDADYFRPGTSSIPVGKDPVQILAATDHSAFFVLSAGDQRVDRVVIEGHDADGLHATVSPIPLPGAPASGLVIGDTLVVVSRDEPVLWLLSTTETGTPSIATVTVDPDAPAHPLHLEPIPGDTTSVIATFRDRPVVARLGLDGKILAVAGVVAACRDGLDNDNDKLVDRDDPDCKDFDDDDESTATGAALPDAPPAAVTAHASSPCADGVDNDGDGFTDGDDGACAVDGKDELPPACDDGVDNDGDGLTDLADGACYSPFGNFEGQLPEEGPFDPALVDAGDAGRFVYVLDERVGQILVFEYDENDKFVRVNVNAASVTPPLLRSVAFSDPTGEVREDDAIPATRPPAFTRSGRKNIEILDGNAFSLASSRLRGELWDRLIPPDPTTGRPTVSFSPNDAEWKPTRCDPGNTTACEQPALDDATWFLFGVNLDGRLQLIESVRRGVPTHRLAQRELNPANRTLTVSAPKLNLRSRLINARGEPQVGYPFLGAAIEELLQDSVDQVSPPELRRFGIWPPSDFEEAPTESWAISYEGRIPGTTSDLGRLVDAGGEPALFDAQATFCEDGVEVGDWVQLTAPVEGTDPALVHPLTVTTDAGEVCPTVAAKTAIVEVRVAKVGMSELVLDPTTARLRPNLPVLDLTAIAAQRVSRRSCEKALDDLDKVLWRPGNLTATSAFSAAALPARFSYNVRVADRWLLWGSRSGFLHRWKWDRAASQCVEDTSLDARLVGRLAERADAVASYDECPPPGEQLAYDRVEELAPATSRFFNPSFGVDIFPGCERDDAGTIVAVPTQQDTTFTFTLTGPQQGSALSISNSVLATHVPMLDFRRQQVQLDASARRATILQMRLSDPRVIATFE